MPEELIIFKKTYDFSRWLFQHTNKFPKSHRFSVAVRIENSVLELLQLITIANHRRQKSPLLQKADEALIALRVFIRLSHDLKFFLIPTFWGNAAESGSVSKNLFDSRSLALRGNAVETVSVSKGTC